MCVVIEIVLLFFFSCLLFRLSVHRLISPPPHSILHLSSSEQWCWSGGRGILIELSFCCRYCVAFQQCTLHNHNEQFFQVGLLDRALISLGLALSPPSTSVSSDFMVLCKCFLKIILTSLYLIKSLGLVGLALYLVEWPIVVLQCLTLLVGSSDL